MRRYVIVFFLALGSVGYGQNGIQHISYGQVDALTPYSFCEQPPMTAAIAALPVGSPPFSAQDITITVNDRGTVVEIPLSDSEHIYGFGLQMGSFDQRGLKKRPIVNDNPLNDLGYTHGPTTFYVSTKGYGVLINTARYTTFYCGTTRKSGDGAATEYVTVDIPGAKGIDLYVFDGPDMKTAVQRYNLFSGGGALPAIWGLGVKYRVKADFSQSQVDTMAAYFRHNHIPCDVLGLEPKWQTAAYSCSYVWNTKLFPTPNGLIDSMGAMGFHLNLWEHAFTSPQSPLYAPLKNKAGDYLVWNGLVPDFADPAARKIFADYRRSQTAVLSAQTLFNSWYLQHPPWLQINIGKNNRNELMDSAAIVEAAIRQLLQLRMSLVPYLYSAFADYHFKGVPPFRALVMDWPSDVNTFGISDEYMIGSGLLAAPLTAGETSRSVYLPAGVWYDFNTNEKFVGGKTYRKHPSLSQIPLFVRAGTILPLAKPVEYIPSGVTFDVTCYVYGDGDTKGGLFEDDGYTFNYEKGEYDWVELAWKDHRGVVMRKGNFKGALYKISGWKVIQ